MPPAKTPEPSLDPEDVAKDGYYVTAESDDNAVDVSNDAYVGVSEEYKTHADDSQNPLFSEDKETREVEEMSVETEKERQVEVGPHGYTQDVPHPSEATPNVNAFGAPEPVRNSDAGEDSDGASKDEVPSSGSPLS